MKWKSFKINRATLLINETGDNEFDYDDSMDDKTGEYVTGNKTNVDENNNDIDLGVSDSTGIKGSCDVNDEDSDTKSETEQDSSPDDINNDDYSDMNGVDDDQDKDSDIDEENYAILMNSDENKDEEVQYEVTAINRTIQRTTKLVNGPPISVFGYTEKATRTRFNPKNLFKIIQEEFNNVAKFCHDQNDMN